LAQVQPLPQPQVPEEAHPQSPMMNMLMKSFDLRWFCFCMGDGAMEEEKRKRWSS
jgi:hypothetical protein